MSYSKNFFIPPAEFGIGSPAPVRTLDNALNAAGGGRNIVAFVNNGYRGGQIETVINVLSSGIRQMGKTVEIVDSDAGLLTICRSSLRGASACHAAASFHSSPTEGPGGIWNYTVRADGAFGSRIYVNDRDNDAQVRIYFC
jgi:ATP-binding cassette subfamily A (ABC1) protein 3